MNKLSVGLTALIFANCATAAPIAAAAAVGGPSLHLEVGGALAARSAIGSDRFLCADNARCRFDVPGGAMLEIIASGPPRHQYMWTGCTSMPAANRCLVRISDRPVLISVR